MNQAINRGQKNTEDIPDLDSLFQRVGSRLGWFKSDISETLKKLTIQSENKKRSKARIHRPQSVPTDEHECKETKENHRMNKFTKVLTEKKDFNNKILEISKLKLEALSDEKDKLTKDLCKKKLFESRSHVSNQILSTQYSHQTSNSQSCSSHEKPETTASRFQVTFENGKFPLSYSNESKENYKSYNDLDDLTNSHLETNKNLEINSCKFPIRSGNCGFALSSDKIPKNQMRLQSNDVFHNQTNNEVPVPHLSHSYREKTCMKVKNEVTKTCVFDNQCVYDVFSSDELPDLDNSYKVVPYERNQMPNICAFDNLHEDLSDKKLCDISNSCLEATQETFLKGGSRNKPLHSLEETKRLSFSSDDNEEDNFECFLQKYKPSSRVSTSNKSGSSSSSSDCFIKDLESDSDNEDDAFYLKLRDRIGSSATPCKSQSSGTSDRVFSSSVTPFVVRHKAGILNLLGSDNVFLSPNLTKTCRKLTSSNSTGDIVDTNIPDFIIVTPASKKRLKERPLSDVRKVETSRKTSSGISFLASLASHVSLGDCHTEAIPFRKDFKKTKINLVSHLFKLCNQEIFDNQLPFDLSITWNSRLTKTAGYCRYSINLSNNPPRKTRIELSEKVCDSCDRVRDTLIHELCHAAAWLINGYKDGHGSFWKAWASKVNTKFSDIPLVSRCHNYQINAKYVYRCLQCKYEVKRHSKSLDTKRKVCGRCRGSFELLINGHGTKSRPASKFALYVKENYKQVKDSNKGINHQKIMQALSVEFSKKISLN